jgi:hypothetical protein
VRSLPHRVRQAARGAHHRHGAVAQCDELWGGTGEAREQRANVQSFGESRPRAREQGLGVGSHAEPRAGLLGSPALRILSVTSSITLASTTTQHHASRPPAAAASGHTALRIILVISSNSIYTTQYDVKA